jgi:MinD superfamily P-loop ATPase
MLRKTIEIDQTLCEGCGSCVGVCHQAAIGIVDGKARLLHELACDGIGNCLLACPAGAIRLVEKEVSGGQTRENETQMPWPVQLKLVSPAAPFFNGRALLISADCAAFRRETFYSEFVKDKVALIGCPKLDGVDYREKIAAILKENEVSALTIVRMSVPCCAGLDIMARKAAAECGKELPLRTVIISTEGDVASGGEAV